MSISGANGANWGNGGFGAMSVIAVLARCLTVRVVPNVYGCPRAATPKFEAKRHGASDHSNNCMLVPLANILPQTLQALLVDKWVMLYPSFRFHRYSAPRAAGNNICSARLDLRERPRRPQAFEAWDIRGCSPRLRRRRGSAASV